MPVVHGLKTACERYLVHVEGPEVLHYDKPDTTSLVIGRLEQGIEVEADQKTGNWYRIKRVSGEHGWVFNATLASGIAMVVRDFPADRRIAYEAGSRDPRVPQ